MDFPDEDMKLGIQNFKVEVLETEDNLHFVKEEVHCYEDGEIELNCDNISTGDHIGEYHQSNHVQSVASPSRREVKLYKCGYPGCGNSYPKMSKLSEHLVTHSEYRPYPCEQTGCTKTFKRKSHLKEHTRTHSNEKQFKCGHEGCGKSYKVKALLNKHLRLHSSCNDIITGKESLKNHIEEINQSVHSVLSAASPKLREVKVYNCVYPDCGNSYPNMSKLWEHVVVHSDSRPYQCEEPGCTKTFKRKGDLKSHTKTHCKEKQFKCEYEGCNKSFKFKASLHKHVRLHGGINFFICNVESCGKKFRSRASLEMHTTFHSDEKNFKCTHEGCGKEFKRKCYLKSHERIHSLKINNTELIKCDYSRCNCITVNKQNFGCLNCSTYNNCDATFTREDDITPDIKLHMKEKRSSSGSLFKCREIGCRKSFPNKRRLEIHMRAHIDARFYKCSYKNCGKSYKCHSSYKIHIQMHNVDTPYMSPHESCRIGFKRKDSLQYHQKIHSLESSRFGLINCDIPSCNMRFIGKCDYYRHMKKHKSELRNRCTFENCTASYWKSDQLRLHMMSHKGQKTSCSSTYPNSNENDTTVLEKSNCGDLKLDSQHEESFITKYAIDADVDKINLKDSNDHCQNICKGEPSQLIASTEQQEDMESYKCSNGCANIILGNYNEQTIDGKKMSSKEVCKVERDEEDIYACGFPGCGEVFKTMYDLSSHTKVHRIEKNIKCTYQGCRKSFYRMADLEYHMSTHSHEKPFKCNYKGCGKLFKSKSNMARHKHLHRAYKPFKCSYASCGQAFIKKYHLEVHLKRHSREYQISNPIACEYPGCDMRFQSKKRMKFHYRSHPKEGPSSSEVKFESHLRTPFQAECEDRPFKCKYEGCGKMFKLKFFLKKHQERTHSRNSNSNEMIVCDYPGCLSLFSIKEDYCRHMTVHKVGTRLRCTDKECYATFDEIGGLKNHISNHTIEKLLCGFKGCYRSFSRKEDLISHEETPHEGKIYSNAGSDSPLKLYDSITNRSDRKLFNCEEEGCLKSFKKRSHLKQHAKVHSSEKQFKCNYENCGKSFKYRGTLSTHMRLHSDKSPFKCNFEGCNQAFKLKLYLQSHQKSHLSNSNSNKTVMCDYPNCNSVFRIRNMTYYIHRRTHRVGKLYPCNLDGCDAAFYDMEDLKKHITEHTVDKFGCDNEYCTQKSSLNEGVPIPHQYTSNSETVYSCTHNNCTESFVNNDCLNAHLSHGEMEESIDKTGVLEIQDNLLIKEELPNLCTNNEEIGLESYITKYEIPVSEDRFNLKDTSNEYHQDILSKEQEERLYNNAGEEENEEKIFECEHQKHQKEDEPTDEMRKQDFEKDKENKFQDAHSYFEFVGVDQIKTDDVVAHEISESDYEF